MEVPVPLILALPVLLTTCWFYTAYLSRTSFQHIRNKRICLLIAHPDDEAMFFSPTLLALTAPELGNHVKILCLSTGNADGLGDTRQRELLDSASLLGLQNPPSDVFIINSPDFPDSMTKSWSASSISNVLSSAFVTLSPSPVPNTTTVSTSRATGKANGVTSRKAADSKGTPPVATIDILLTFDGHGVSGHTNHVSLYQGARAWLSGLMAEKAGWGCPVDLYTLSSTNIIRKYMSMADAPFTLFWGVLRDALNDARGQKLGKRSQSPRKLFFVSDWTQWRRAQRAMTDGHRSQMRWFRWGWIGVGRYMVVNDLRREIIK
ncbi:MAG: hypothetical protein Q9191_002038 [Dirinaria sp. TL-2023a]